MTDWEQKYPPIRDQNPVILYGIHRNNIVLYICCMQRGCMILTLDGNSDIEIEICITNKQNFCTNLV